MTRPASGCGWPKQDVDRILGNQALFQIPDVQKYGGPSPSVIWRARRAGLIEVLQVGGGTRLSRATVKRILLEGLPPVTFVYGKQGAA